MADWSPDPPWGPQAGDIDAERTCVRCEQTITAYHRHFWRPCRPCAVWSFLGTQLLTALGCAGARQFMYWGARPDCSTCDGWGYLPCEDQDMSILRKSGACATCGAYAFVLVRVVEPKGEIEGSGRHYDDVAEAEHEVSVGAMPLIDTLSEHLDRNIARPL